MCVGSGCGWDGPREVSDDADDVWRISLGCWDELGMG